jgi:hypothetical protein
VNVGWVWARESTNNPISTPPPMSTAIVVPIRAHPHSPGGSEVDCLLSDTAGLALAGVSHAAIAQRQLLVVSGASSSGA